MTKIQDLYADIKPDLGAIADPLIELSGRFLRERGNFLPHAAVLTEEGGKPYGGCYVNVKVDIKAMKAKEKIPNQIYATLLTVQFVSDGEAFGAAPGTAEGFDDVEGAESSDDLMI